MESDCTILLTTLNRTETWGSLDRITILWTAEKRSSAEEQQTQPGIGKKRKKKETWLYAMMDLDPKNTWIAWETAIHGWDNGITWSWCWFETIGWNVWSDLRYHFFYQHFMLDPGWNCKWDGHWLGHWKPAEFFLLHVHWINISMKDKATKSKSFLGYKEFTYII